MAKAVFKWAKQIGKWIYQALTGAFKGGGSNLVDELLGAVSKGLTEGNFLKVAGDILSEGVDQLKTPLEGVKAPEKTPLDLKFDLEGLPEWLGGPKKEGEAPELPTADWDKWLKDMMGAMRETAGEQEDGTGTGAGKGEGDRGLERRGGLGKAGALNPADGGRRA